MTDTDKTLTLQEILKELRGQRECLTLLMESELQVREMLRSLSPVPSSSPEEIDGKTKN